ncbi:hypothetical protein ASPCAL12805 [Aspergillus calidoustus]|uniref:Uncharacterized protein n=1 Tax=Aspergillus calidoustus TaxID=454130 RepID=A0A0U5GG07_ASPCI|nr:hypothetical protein ASPCAL12805 [Aspergillus calidoustus]
MTIDLTFDIRYDDELAHEYYGDGKQLSQTVREIYRNRDLIIPDEFRSTMSSPPVNLMQVIAPDGTDVDELRRVEIPQGLSIEIWDLDDE